MAQIESMTRSIFMPHLSSVRLASESTVVVYDSRLSSVSPELKKWLKKFPRRWGVQAGEDLKDVRRLPQNLATFAKIAGDLAPRSMTIVAIGGGSVGDFVAFLASVYKRGVELVHIPSTWLAAIDSAHGGKTALNVGGAKNQIGTFYSAKQVILVRSLLDSQNEERARDAIAELAKVALIDGGSWAKKLAKSQLAGSNLLWKFLKPAIKAKMKIVARDPRETKGLRQVLNFGHTFGHVIEAKTGWTHGRSVAQGLFFALEFGEQLGVTSPDAFERSVGLLAHLGLKPERPKRALKASDVRRLLAADKKRDQSGRVTFVFLKNIGRVERRSVAIDAIVKEAKRTGWCR